MAFYTMSILDPQQQEKVCIRNSSTSPGTEARGQGAADPSRVDPPLDEGITFLYRWVASTRWTGLCSSQGYHVSPWRTRLVLRLASCVLDNMLHAWVMCWPMDGGFWCRVTLGRTLESYGLHCASLAGLSSLKPWTRSQSPCLALTLSLPANRTCRTFTTASCMLQRRAA